jgi:hypothetical protein
MTELSLKTGAEYQVFLLVEVRDSTMKIDTDRLVYDKIVKSAVPPEFRHITQLYSPRALLAFYPLIPQPLLKSEKRYYLPLQRFAELNPSSTTYWNIDFKTRYTGHFYTMLATVSDFAKAQPRKELWERNEGLYIPSFHRPYATGFFEDISEQSTTKTIWTPLTVEGIRAHSPMPPGPEIDDNYTWGVGEEADLITLSPIFDPASLNFEPKSDIYGYNTSSPTSQKDPGLNVTSQSIPLRASTGTFARFSKRLLDSCMWKPHRVTTCQRACTINNMSPPWPKSCICAAPCLPRYELEAQKPTEVLEYKGC